ncbi:FlgO family outer membrane protein [Xylophilus sp.]|uniref:FlgO family outer membrane protein n=1 Tax=Xylophilus sp. TaxID=2653893 RepID=UPI003FCCBCD6
MRCCSRRRWRPARGRAGRRPAGAARLRRARRPGRAAAVARGARLAQAQGVQAVVVGTCAVAATAVYVSLRLVRPADAAVLTAQPLVLPMGANMRSMLR